MALKGLDVFKLTPKTNCKDCGNPTCMAFAMKVAQGAVEIGKCPHMSEDALAQLSDATAPAMKKITLGTDGRHTLGGETVLFRHEKTFVSKNLFAVSVCPDCFDSKLPGILAVDYERIGERMYIELLNLEYTGDKDAYTELVKKAAATGRTLILECADPDTARAALEICAASGAARGTLLRGADAGNFEAMSKLATESGAVLCVTGKDMDELYDTAEAIEKLGNKNLVLDAGRVPVKDAFAGAVNIRRSAIKDGNRTFGYPALIDAGKLAQSLSGGASGDEYLQTALASVFTLKYGSIIVMDNMSYAQALPLFGLRQNIYTDPQKPMKVEPGIYPLCGADENAICVITVDFALTYFIVSGELERAGVPLNLLVADAGGYSVLTAWAAGKFSASSIAKFIKDYDIESKIKSRVLAIPGKVAVLKGELEEQLPGWTVITAPNEAIESVKFFKNLKG